MAVTPKGDKVLRKKSNSKIDRRVKKETGKVTPERSGTPRNSKEDHNDKGLTTMEETEGPERSIDSAENEKGERKPKRRTKRDRKKSIRKRNSTEEEKSDDKTVFEKTKSKCRPAIVVEKESQLKWKDGCKPEKSGGSAEGISSSSSSYEKDWTKDVQFMAACRVMVQVRQCNILEDCLTVDENKLVRQFFDSDAKEPSPEVFSLLFRAVDECYTRIMFKQDYYDVILNTEMRSFLMVKETAKSRLMDVVVNVPVFLPLMWGGTNVEMQKSEIEQDFPGFIQKSIKSGFKLPKTRRETRTDDPSPWSGLMKKAIEEERMKEKEKEDSLKRKAPPVEKSKKPEKVLSMYQMLF